ncbi:hypothetical protein YYG_02875 [Plasmodium vinckei petteri]|uniref:Gamma-tubulin complex component n=2 Tax=Plasmodium vinckei petteri TaxID=138298 RepID=W7AUC0_PLAVN|nr:hypothetical protein YYG_02875 [Plasmodium vinckei petteri]
MSLNPNFNPNTPGSPEYMNESGENKNTHNFSNINNTYTYKENYYNKTGPSTGLIRNKNEIQYQKQNADQHIQKKVTVMNNGENYAVGETSGITRDTENVKNATTLTKISKKLDEKNAENFKSITHFAKYLFFIAKKIATIHNKNNSNSPNTPHFNEEVQKMLVKHLIYKLNKILSSLINYNILDYNETTNIKHDIEYYCLKNSNLTLNKIRVMLKKLEDSKINYKYILHILLKLKMYQDEVGENEITHINVATNLNNRQIVPDPNKQNEQAEKNETNTASLKISDHTINHNKSNNNRLIKPDEIVEQANNVTNLYNEQNIVPINRTQNNSITETESNHSKTKAVTTVVENDMIHKKNFMNKSIFATIILNNKFNSLDIDENLLLRDLIYPLQGINGEYIKFNKRENAFCVCNRKVSMGMHHFITSISKVGILFRKLQKYINISTNEMASEGTSSYNTSNYFDNFEEDGMSSNPFQEGTETVALIQSEKMNMGDSSNSPNNIDDGFSSEGSELNHGHTDSVTKDGTKYNTQILGRRKGSLVIDALYQIVREYLNEYYKLLSHIESEINEHIHKNTVYIGIKVLYALLHESYKILRVLVNVIDESQRSTGCQFLSFVYSKSQVYDYDEEKIYKKILQKCIKPINLILKQWVQNGILKDKYKETFISLNNNVTSEQIWMYKFVIDMNNIPLFLNTTTAKKILLTGKCVYLLNYLSVNNTKSVNWGVTDTMPDIKFEQENKHDFFDRPSSIPINTDIFSINDFHTYVENIDNYIKHISKKKNQELFSLLIKQYGLYEHFKAFRHFILLVDGDLFENIFESMKTDLYMNAEELKRHYLNNKLELCIKSSSIFTSNKNIIKKLIIEKFNAKRGDIGWDILVLDFVVEKPLDIIFTNKIKNIYKSINVLLIKLKKIQCELSNIWYLFTHLFKIINLIYYNSVFTHCNIIRNEMFHFIQNILSYFYYDVIDMNWYEFKKKIFTCNDLDMLIHEHYNYVTQIQIDLFLGNYTDMLNSKSSQNLDNISGTPFSNTFEDDPNNYLASSFSNDINSNYSPTKNENTQTSQNEKNNLGNQADTIPPKNMENETLICLNKILDIISRFINLTSSLISTVCENYSDIKSLTEKKRQQRNDQNAEPNTDPTMNDVDIDYINNYINYNIIGEKTIKDIKMLLKYYRNYIYKFICLLLSENKYLYMHSKNTKRDKLYSLRLLASRLDFNLYYVNISKIMDSQKNMKLNISKQINMINK